MWSLKHEPQWLWDDLSAQLLEKINLIEKVAYVQSQKKNLELEKYDLNKF